MMLSEVMHNRMSNIIINDTPFGLGNMKFMGCWYLQCSIPDCHMANYIGLHVGYLTNSEHNL